MRTKLSTALVLMLAAFLLKDALCRAAETGSEKTVALAALFGEVKYSLQREMNLACLGNGCAG